MKFDSINLKKNSTNEIKSRIENFYYIYKNPLAEEDRYLQGLRCLDCHVPFCKLKCPIKNNIPDFNDYIAQKDIKNALKEVLKTNPFPEITGSLCPAFCENQCVLQLKNEPVSIKDNELFLGNKLYEYLPFVPKQKNGKKIAIIGSGIAGLSVAFEMNQKGFDVEVFEKESKIGGLLAFGIAPMKFDYKSFEKRIEFLKQEGIKFFTNHTVLRKDIKYFEKKYDAVVLSKGTLKQKKINQFERKNVYPAIEYIRGIIENKHDKLDLTDKKVAIIGLGDTAYDCISFAIRQKCKDLTCFSIYKKQEYDTIFDWIYQKETKNNFVFDEIEQYFKKDVINYNVGVCDIINEDQKVVLQYQKIKKVLGQKGKRQFEFFDKKYTQDFDIVLYSIGFQKDESDKIEEHLAESDFSNNHISDNLFVSGDYKLGPSSFAHAIADANECVKAILKYLG